MGTQLPGVGSARVFVRSDPSTSESWVQQAILTPDDGVGTVWYGYTVAIDGNRALLGVNEDEQNQGTNTKAFIFERVGQNWSQVFMVSRIHQVIYVNCCVCITKAFVLFYRSTCLLRTTICLKSRWMETPQ